MAKQPTAAPTPSAGAEGATITVVGPAKGSWRAGRFFGPTATVIDLSTLTPAQLDAIKKDPRLHVSGG